MSEMRSKQLHKFEKESKEMGKAGVSKSRARHQIRGDVGARPKSGRKCSHDLYTMLYMVMICLGALWMLKYFDDVCY